MHCNLRPPEPRQPFAALITTPCQVWSRWTYPLPHYSVFTADTLLYDVTLSFDPVTLTFDLWPWTFVTHCLWHDETLYQIWTQSIYPQRNYYDYNFWPYDLEHVKYCSWWSLTFDNLPVPAWITSFLMLIRYVTLWPWSLTSWPWTLEQHFGCHAFKLCTKFERNFYNIEECLVGIFYSEAWSGFTIIIARAPSGEFAWTKDGMAFVAVHF